MTRLPLTHTGSDAARHPGAHGYGTCLPDVFPATVGERNVETPVPEGRGSIVWIHTGYVVPRGPPGTDLRGLGSSRKTLIPSDGIRGGKGLGSFRK